MALSGADKIAIVNSLYERGGVGTETFEKTVAAFQSLRLKADLGLDSLDIFELLLRIEELCPWFNSQAADIKTDDMTVNELFDLINEQSDGK